MSLHAVLIDHGYRLAEDAWDTNGRVTYIHADDADRAHLAELVKLLGALGWIKAKEKLRSFTNGGEEIEIEPGGSDVSGHFLHHLNLAVIS